MTKNSIGIICFFLLSLLPGLGVVSGVAPSRLGGAESSVTKVPLSTDTFWNEQWQQSIEKWWQRNVGFRMAFVRSDNQLSMMLFRELGLQNRERVVIGKDSYLFEKAYITAYQNSVKEPPLEAIKSVVAQIKKTQDLLRARGIAFLLIISPSKASIMPEKIPDHFKIEGRPLRDYQAFAGELKAEGVSYFDSHQWLNDHKAELASPIFYRSGAHWSQDSGCRTIAEAYSMLESQINKPLKKIGCLPVKTRSRPLGQDADLLRLANIWSTSRFAEPYIYPNGPVDKTEGRFTPRVTFVGSSFLWDPLDLIRKYRLADKKRSRMFYYFKSRAINPVIKLGPIDPEASNWREEVLASDAVVVEINESAVLAAGFGFFEAFNKRQQ